MWGSLLGAGRARLLTSLLGLKKKTVAILMIATRPLLQTDRDIRGIASPAVRVPTPSLILTVLPSAPFGTFVLGCGFCGHHPTCLMLHFPSVSTSVRSTKAALLAPTLQTILPQALNNRHVGEFAAAWERIREMEKRMTETVQTHAAQLVGLQAELAAKQVWIRLRDRTDISYILSYLKLLNGIEVIASPSLYVSFGSFPLDG